jgi:hypothetical protein
LRALLFGAGIALVSPKPVALLSWLGGVLGAAVGFYAAWGASVVARVLAIPGLIVSFLIALVS